MGPTYQGQQSSFPMHQQSLPSIASLTNDLPPAEPSPGLPRQVLDTRDSGNWSQSQQSKHSSYGSSGLPLHNILNAEESPSRTSMLSEGPQSTRASLVPSMHSSNYAFDNRQSIQSIDAVSLHESRRSSVDSRVNLGMGHLQITPSSPCQEQNTSRTSLVSSLQQQRGITSDANRLSGGPLSPLGSRMGPRAQAAPRRAPVISPNPRSVTGMPNPTAAAPTKGYAWAFPDENDENRDSSDSASERMPSRANSFAASVNSSIYTIDSQLPPGQRRLEDDQGSLHHHSIPHRSVTSLAQSTDTQINGTSGNYSRTPELRVSHKMAERKRRSEMKGLFDDLNAILPNSPGGKSSKWEVLSKAIDHIKKVRTDYDILRRDVERLRGDSDMRRHLEEENRMLQSEMHLMWQQLHRVEPGKQQIFGQFTAQFERDTVSSAQPLQGSMLTQAHQPQQPQQVGQQNGWPQHNATSGAMQGVEFGAQQPYAR